MRIVTSTRTPSAARPGTRDVFRAPSEDVTVVGGSGNIAALRIVAAAVPWGPRRVVVIPWHSVTLIELEDGDDQGWPW